jgi:hypothetical protein
MRELATNKKATIANAFSPYSLILNSMYDKIDKKLLRGLLR